MAEFVRDSGPTLLSTETIGPEDWDEGEEYEEEEEGDDDIAAEAQEIARRLGEELWADIRKAQKIPVTPAALDAIPQATSDIEATYQLSPKEKAAVVTMKGVLAFLANDAPAQFTLASTVIQGLNGESVLSLIQRSVASNIVPKGSAMALSQALVSLARSEALFGDLRLSNASAIQLDKGKRKREANDDGGNTDRFRGYKRSYVPDGDLQAQISEAVRIITQTLGTPSSQRIDANLVSSIRLQLHQVFLFAVTSSAGGGPDMHTLQEISGLIQVIGVLSGIQIGQTSNSLSNQPVPTPQHYPTYSWPSSQPPLSTDIGTAVYPCHIVSCRKTFSRLYSLRAHQRSHAMHRPFKCNFCPASFARNHDLKRHTKLHDRKAWKCGGCQKIFSRRDAIKRHKTGTKVKGPKSEVCLNADVVEVELDDEALEDPLREERRAKMWHSIASSQGVSLPSHMGFPDMTMEEGEIQSSVIRGTQATIISLHSLLQAQVGNALGTPVGQTKSTISDPTGGQATLASVIARAQLQNLPPNASTSHTIQNYISSTNIGAVHEFTSNEDVNGAIREYNSEDQSGSSTMPSLSMYGLSDEQTKLLELAIANAAQAAQALAEAEAALEEEEDYDEDDGIGDASDGQADMEQDISTE